MAVAQRLDCDHQLVADTCWTQLTNNKPVMTSSNRRNAKLSLKQLESYLQDLDDFEQPKIELEQYATPPHIAAVILNTIDRTYDDLEGKFVADLGCGTGRLSIGSIICGAEMVVGFDVDGGAIEQALRNAADMLGSDNDDGDEDSKQVRACEKINFVQIDISARGLGDTQSPLHNKFDTVVMNPPFGTKNNPGLDVTFLRRAIDICNGFVYSLHKTTTREVGQI